MKRHYYITGVSGTGKSTVTEALGMLGYRSIDLDEIRGLASWRDHKGEPVTRPPKIEIDGEFIARNRYCFDVKRVARFVRQAKRDISFYSGAASNQAEYMHWFDKVFVLDCAGELMRKRLTKRPGPYGKNPSMLNFVEATKSGYVEQLARSGAIVIDSSRDLQAVVNDVLLHASIVGESRLCYVLEPGSGSDGWKAALRAAGHVVASTRQPEPDIVDERGKVIATSDFVAFRRVPPAGRSSPVDLGKLASLAREARAGPIFVADDSRNLDNLLNHVGEMFVLLRRDANYLPQEKAAIQRALDEGAYPVDCALDADEMADRMLAIAKRPGPGYVGQRRANLRD